jgi:hypothetical protein
MDAAAKLGHAAATVTKGPLTCCFRVPPAGFEPAAHGLGIDQKPSADVRRDA